jgi:RNA polymerase sigma-70 factor (ECF subfamily)
MIGGVGDRAQARFWASLGEARRRELAVHHPGWAVDLRGALDEAARAAAQQGQLHWLARDDFAAEIGARLERDPALPGAFWAHLHVADLYLACACARGLPAALARFEALYGLEIARAARRFERPGLAADDLVQSLRTKLLAGDAGGGPRIATYGGQGFLLNWIRVSATRTFIDCTRGRAEAAEVPIGNELCAALAAPGADPELALLKREHLRHFKAAFAEAVGALDSSDRLVLKQHLVEGLTIDQIGGLYRLHRATAARRLARARETLLAGTRAALARRLGLPLERLAGVLELVSSRLEASVERLLG